jgi:ElaB/YqjD/DUF883 family membrane-anchored ribosome-binding protein
MSAGPKPSRVRKTANGVADAAEAAESRIAEAARKAEEVVRESGETLRAQTRAYADTAAEKIETAQKVVVERVKEKPVESAITAFGIGLVVGMLIAGRRH